MELDYFDSFLFDCDGVVLNSNKIKTKAFAESVAHFGHLCVDALISYHISNGGVSRYKKFQYFIDEILPIYRSDFSAADHPDLHDNLLASYSGYLETHLLNCEIEPSLDLLRSSTLSSNWFIVSGGDQSELRRLFALRGLYNYFNGGIYGSPATKYDILNNLFKSGHIGPRSLFIGDSLLDYQVSCHFGTPFVFVRQWSEFKDIDSFSEQNSIPIINNLSELFAS